MHNSQPSTKDIEDIIVGLHCEGMSIENIAQVTSSSESKVQQTLQAAEQKGIYGYRPVMQFALGSEAQNFIYHETLTFSLNNVLRNKPELSIIDLSITHSPRSMFTKYEIGAEGDTNLFNAYRQAEWDSLQVAGHRAALELSRALFDGEDHIIGINWGTAVRVTVSYIHPLPSQLGNAKLFVVSLFGDLEFYSGNSDAEHEYLDSNAHVIDLTKRLGKHGQAILLNVPGFIPAQFSQNEDIFKALQDFSISHSSFRRIFGDLPPDGPQNPRPISGIINPPTEAKIAHMDTIITGFGAADNHTMLHNYLKPLLAPKEVQYLLEYRRTNKVVGDIGGHLLASPEGKSDGNVVNFLKKVNRRLIATQPSDFVDVASRHRKTGKGVGVAGITVGARKAKILYTLLSWVPCPISRLVIDTHCALALLYLIDSQEFKKFIRSEEGRRLVEGCEEWSDGTRQLIPAR